MCAQYPSEKAALELLELDLKTVLSHHVGAGNQTWVLQKNSQCYGLLKPSLQPLAALNCWYG